jgi:dTDP-4-dehydrorhamnose reductase
MKILITGADGFLGKQLMFTLYPTNNVVDIDKEIDITEYSNLQQTILHYAPNIIIHCAGIVDPAICEENKELAYKVNIIGTANLIQICKELNIKLIFISTDCIFSGIKEEYYENDIPDPINYYGWTKYCGENLVKTLDNYLILRLSWLYGKDSKFIKQILNCNSPIYLDHNQIRYPLLVDDLTYIISDLINDNSKRIYHIRGQEGVTKFYLAHLISEKFNLKNSYNFLEEKDDSYLRPNIKFNYNYFSQIHSLIDGLEIIKHQSENR